MSSRQSGDRSRRKRARIIVLHENGQSYSAVTRDVGGNATHQEYESFVYAVRKHNLYKTEKEKSGKRARQLFMVK